MIVAQVRGVRFEYNQDWRGMMPVEDDVFEGHASRALRDVTLAFGFKDSLDYLVALTRDKRHLLETLKARPKRKAR